MNCPQCGSALQATAKFCANCGAKVPQTAPSVTTAGETANQAANTQPTQPAQSAQPTPTAQPAQPLQHAAGASGQQAFTSASGNPATNNPVNGFFNFLVEAFKSPEAAASNINASQKLYGLLTMGILTLIVPLLDLFTGLIYTRRDPFGYFGEIFGTIYKRIFIDQFLFSIITFAVSLTLIIVVLYLAANVLRVDIGFMDVAARFGAFMVIPTAIFILKSLVGLISLSTLAGYIHSFAMLGVAAAILFTFSSFRAKASKLDNFYLQLIVLVVSYLLYRIVLLILY